MTTIRIVIASGSAAILLAAAWSLRPITTDNSPVPRPQPGNRHLFHHPSRLPEIRIDASAPHAHATRPLLSAQEADAKRVALLAKIQSAESLPNRELQDEALARICCEWAEFDPRGAVENAITWELEYMPGLLEALALQWAASDIVSARQWAEMQPSSEFRSELVSRIGFAMAQDDPAAAADYVLKECVGGPIIHEALISVLHQWALQDLDAARSWAGSFTDGQLRQQALQDIEGIERYQTDATGGSSSGI